MKNNIIFLTGGTGLVGKKLISDLNLKRFNIYFTSRNKKSIIEIEEIYKKSKYFVKGICIDFEKENYENILKIFFKNNIYPFALINNARNIENLKTNNGVTSSINFIKEFKLNVVLPYSLAIFFNKSSTLKKIINISSIYGIVPPNKNLYIDNYNSSPIQYGVSKAALNHLSKELAVRFSDSNISVNTISYGGIEGRATNDFKNKYSNLTPSGNMLTLEEISAPIIFLLSPKNNSITGHNLVIDGGYTIW